MNFDDPKLIKRVLISIIAYLTTRYSKEHNTTLEKAFTHIFDSAFYKELMDRDNKYFCESPSILYEMSIAGGV